MSKHQNQAESVIELEPSQSKNWWENLIVEQPDYHTNYLNGFSHSMLNVFRGSVSVFHKKFILGESTWKRSKAMDFGSAFHAWMLERNEFDDSVALQPTCAKRSKADKLVWEDFGIENKYRAWVTQGDLDEILAMEQAILKDEEASKWMVHLKGVNEKMVCWQATKETLGAACLMKCKPDRLLPSGLNFGNLETDVIVDLKTTLDVSPESVAKSAASFGYHCQASLYIDGVRALNGGRPCRHVSVFINKTAPYEVSCVEYSQEALEIGRDMNTQAIQELVERLEFNNFKSRTSNRLIQVDLPHWYSARWNKENGR